MVRGPRKEPVVLVELGVVEQRYRAVLEVLDGVAVTDVARRFGVSRQTVHAWLRRYGGVGGLANLADRSSRPAWCPHQMSPVTEARVVALRGQHPGWGPTRIRYQLGKEDVDPLPGRSSVYRALVRHGLIDPAKRKRTRSEFRRWERGRAMELWQMDVMGGVRLVDGSEVKVVTGIDDHSRFVVCATVVARATAHPVCAALLATLGRHGVPEQVLTDNGKVFTGRFGPRGSTAEVMFDRICAENGIRHLLTAPRSPTTTGKVERLHKTMRAEFFNHVDGKCATIADLQQALDDWVAQYNTERPHQSLGMCPPIDRFRLAATDPAGLSAVTVDVPVAAVAPAGQASRARPPGVSRWVDQAGRIRLAGFGYRVGATFAGEQVEAVCAQGLVEIWHRGVLVASHGPAFASRQACRCPPGWAAPDPSGHIWAHGHPRRRRHRRGLVRRHHVPGRSGLGRSQPAGGDRRRLGTAVRRQHGGQGAPDPARPGQGARRVRHPQRATPQTGRHRPHRRHRSCRGRHRPTP